MSSEKKRSNIFKKSIVKNDSIVVSSDSDDFEGAIQWVDSIEHISISSLKKLGYNYDLNGLYFKISDKWIHKSFLKKEDCYEKESALLYSLILKNCEDENSEIFFISEVLKFTYLMRLNLSRLYNENNADAVQTFIMTAQMMAEFMFWREEFPLGQWIAPGRKLQADRKRGGQTRGSLQAEERRGIHFSWSREASSIWAEKPGLPAMEVARRVKRRLNRTETADAIYRIIRKSGRT